MAETPVPDAPFLVAVSEDGRHAIWPAFRPLPWGWSPEGFRGDEAACMAHVDRVWTELAPAEHP